MRKDSFVFYRDWFVAIETLDDSVRLEVYDAIMHEAFGLEKRQLSSLASMAMKFIKPQIERDNDKYEATCRRNVENGKKGGRPPKTQENQQNPVGYLETQENPKNPENPVGYLKTQKTQRNPEKPKKADNDIQDTNVSMSISNNIEKEEISKDKKKKEFVPPTVEEVAEYIKLKGYHFNAKSFVDYYEADDWHYGQGSSRKKVQNWKRCCSTWEGKRNDDSSDLFREEQQETSKYLVIDGQIYR